jgi:hypothetical protein
MVRDQYKTIAILQNPLFFIVHYGPLNILATCIAKISFPALH